MSMLNLDALHENQLQATGELNPLAPQTRLHLPSGQTFVIPTELLLNPGSANAVPAALSATAMSSAQGPTALPAEEPLASGNVIPLVEEQIAVGKREVETAKVRLRRETEEFVQNVNVALANTTWEVEHIPVNQVITDRPEIRHVGEATIFPLVEERLVVTRELFLREEVHVRKVTSVVEKSAQFPLKRDVLIETRTETPGS